MNATGFLAHEAGLEQDFWAAETLRSNGDDVAIRQFVSLLLVTALRCSLHLAVKVQGDVAKFLLQIDGVGTCGSGAAETAKNVEAESYKIGRVVRILDRHLSSACFISMFHHDSDHDLSIEILQMIYIH